MYRIKYLLIGIIIIIAIYGFNNQSRVRIISQDPTETAQEIKTMVKELVINYLQQHSTVDLDDLKLYLSSNLEEAIYQMLDVSYESHYFDVKVISGVLVPSGKYPTLVIKIGEAQGENWWCLLYPQFYGLSYGETDNVEYLWYFYEKLMK